MRIKEMKKEYYEDLVDIDVSAASALDDTYLIEASTKDTKEIVCPYCSSSAVVKFGNTSKKYKDIPYDSKKVTIMLKSKNYYCKDCEKKFQKTLICISPEHMITKRLYDYIVLRCQQTSKPVIASETGVSRRVIQDLSADYLSLNYSMCVSGSIFLVSGKWKNITRMIVIDAGNNNVLYCPATVEKAIENLIYLYKNHKVHRIIIPYDEVIIDGLIAAGISKDALYYEFDYYINYIVSKVYDAYRHIRGNKNIAKVFKTPVSLENEYFYKAYRLLFGDDLNKFEQLVSKNEVFNDYYLLKESVVDSLEKSIRNKTNIRLNSLNFPSIHSLYGSIAHMSYATYRMVMTPSNEAVFDIANKQIELLLNEVSLSIKKIVVFPEQEKETRSILFSKVCTDLENGVSKEWIQYKYSKNNQHIDKRAL